MWLVDLLLSCTVPLLALLGLPFVRLFEKRTALSLGEATVVAASLALGLAFAMTGGMALGFSGLLRAPFVIAWLFGGALAASIAFVRLRPVLPRVRVSLPLLLCAALGLFYLLLATVPPWYRDSMAYHLALPRLFARGGGYVPTDDNIFASFPLGYESILSLLYALGSRPDHVPPFNPRLVGVWSSLGAALAAVGLARAIGVSEKRAGYAALLLLLVPTFAEFGTSAYVESLLLLFATLALTCAVRVRAGDHALLVPAALFAGACASVKYPGLAVCAFLLLLLLAGGLRTTPEQSAAAARRAVVFGLVAGLVGAPFYVRNLLARGNPVFPLAFGTFGGRGWDEWRDFAYGVTLAEYGRGRELIDYLLLPLRLFSATELDRGFEGAIGIVAGLGFVAGLFALRRSAARPLALFALLWSIFWALTVQQARFYLVAVPPLFALLLLSLETRPRLSRVGPASCAAVALLFAAPAFAKLWTRQPTSAWLAGSIDEDDVLTTMLPESYPVHRALDTLVPEEAKIYLIWMRGYTYYLPRAARFDSVFEAYRLEALLDEAPTTRAVVESLRADGITHLLVHHRFFLQHENAELRPGRTAKLAKRFDELRAGGLIRAVRSWGEITLYEL